MKYARPVDHSELKDGSDIRMIDVIDTSNFEPRPEWGQTDEALLDKIFEHQKDEWAAAGQWFVAVPETVEPCAFDNGDGTFTNPEDKPPEVNIPEEPVDQPA